MGPAISFPAGEIILMAPKEQPPRKLSGKRTARNKSTLESEDISSTDGVSPSDKGQISQVPMTEGAPMVRVCVPNVLYLEK